MDNSTLHGARSEKRSRGGQGGCKRGEVVFFWGQDQLRPAASRAECEATGKTAVLGKPCPCWQRLPVPCTHLSAAVICSCPPLKREMSFQAKFPSQKFINLILWPPTFFLVFVPLSENTYSLFSCHSGVFCLTGSLWRCAARPFISGLCLHLQ